MGVCYFRSFNILMDDLLFPLILFQKKKKKEGKKGLNLLKALKKNKKELDEVHWLSSGLQHIFFLPDKLHLAFKLITRFFIH